MPTTLSVTNRSNNPVVAFITLGATMGCVRISDLRLSDSSIRITPMGQLMGKFTLPARKSTQIVPNPPGKCINGNIAFGTPPLNGPSPGFPPRRESWRVHHQQWLPTWWAGNDRHIGCNRCQYDNQDVGKR